MFFTSTFFGDVVTLLITLSVIVIGYFKWSFSYWRRRNVPYLEPSIPFGNVGDGLRSKEHMGVTLEKIYNEMKSRNWKYGGIYFFTRPHLLILDLDIVKNIVIKDFQYFVDREAYVNENEPLQYHLLNLTGDKWRNLRSKLTPTFTSGKMKMMFSVMAECTEDLQKRMESERMKKEPINIKEILACFSTNIIGSCAFGLEFKALEDENSKFRMIGKRMFSNRKLLDFKRMFALSFPKLARCLNVTTSTKGNSDFIINLVQETISYREKNNYKRNDFMQLLINLMNNPPANPSDNDGKPLTLDEVAAQAIVFYAAGFETSSTLMTFTLYELAKNQDIQERLRNEINTVLAQHDNKITYEAIQNMKYLTQVIDESLRIHSPGTTIRRKCVKDYKLPNSDVIIEKGTIVMTPLLGIHHDEEYYPNPTKFDPDRFSDENRKKRHNCAHMPFGEGPRNCIGMRFGLLQSKVGLVAVLRNYKFTLNEKTLQPLVYKPGVILSTLGEIWLNAEKI